MKSAAKVSTQIPLNAPAKTTAGKDAQKPMAQCQLERAPQAKGPQNVGEHLLLSCQGELGQALQKEAQVKAPEGGDYSLVILQVLETTPQNFKAVVTSYRVGQHQAESFEITDRKVSFLTSAQNFTVETVIDPKDQQQGQPPKPYASVGPFLISYPLWFWLTIAGAFLVISAVIGLVWYRRRRRLRLQAELEKHMTMLSPFSQFSKDARLSVKRMNGLKTDVEAVELVKKLDEDFRLYLIRELKVPALQVANSEVLREIKRRHRGLYEDFQGDLRRLLFEFEKARQGQVVVKLKDCEELLYLSRQVAERIFAGHSVRAGASSGAGRRVSR